MDKQELLADIRRAHAELEAAIARLDDAALLRPAAGMAGWTRRDVLAHVGWWTRHSADVVAGVRTGVDPYPDGDWPSGIDALNARILELRGGLSAAEARGDEAAAYEELVTRIEAATDEELFGTNPVAWLPGRVVDVVVADTTDHWPEHVPHLAAG